MEVQGQRYSKKEENDTIVFKAENESDVFELGQLIVLCPHTWTNYHGQLQVSVKCNELISRLWDIKLQK